MHVMEKELTWLPPSDAASANFAAILNIIFSIKEGDVSQIDRAASKALRLTCKATKDVVDTYVTSFFRRDQVPGGLHNLSPWPWLNITEVELRFANYENNHYYSRNHSENEIHDKEVQRLVTLPLLKLQSLVLDTACILPLAQSNWPMLTNLDLTLHVPRKRSWDLHSQQICNFLHGL